MTSLLRTAGLAVVIVLMAAGSALGQGLPGRPDAPPPDPPPPTKAPSRAPSTPSSPSNPSTPSGPSDAEIQAQREAAAAAAAKAAAEQRRQEAIRRRQEAIRKRQEAIRLAREKRAREFRDLQAADDGTLAVGTALDDASQALDALAVSAAVVVSGEDAAPPADSSGHGGALLVVLLLASGVSAALVVLPMGLRATLERREGELAGHARGVGSYVVERIPLLEHRRVELAGVSVACFLVACLMLVGLL